MSDSNETGLNGLQAAAKRAGLDLSEEEAAKIMAGVERNRENAADLRGLISPEVEPSPIFSASPEAAGKE